MGLESESITMQIVVNGLCTFKIFLATPGLNQVLTHATCASDMINLWWHAYESDQIPYNLNRVSVINKQRI